MDQLPFAPSQETTTELNSMSQSMTSRPNTLEIHNLQLDTGEILRDPGMIPIPPSPPTSSSSTPMSTTDSSVYELWKRAMETPLMEQSGKEPPSKGSTTLFSLPGESIEKVDEPQSEEPMQEDIEEMNLQSHLERPDKGSTPQSLARESTPPPELQERHGESTLVPPVRQGSSGSNPKLP
ncbi:uncharacterized protein EV420DRAFT_1484636 [Desarmillaria tabescens]|uniref:Uncharacterized protein n=1 Tax=Armillaria tabescens TaxID=1929756 RepID=A0AA39JKP3_ARMTA|nr:uncharacterized protein EV420DRAFT_1484636 [Desarmillaria tabescens]KAK0444517.1 hypothetical protein EV420DRAFT_1484636 [Desarmillaria tabescens]